MKTELIKRIQENRDSEAFAEVLSAHERMLYGIINTFRDGAGDYLMSKEDLYQEACIALFDACLSYREDGGARFSSYAYVVIKRRLGRVVHNMYTTYQEENTSYDKYEDLDRIPMFMAGYVGEDPVSYSEKKTKEEQMENLLNNLSELDRQILTQRLRGRSYKEIAVSLGISTKKVDNRLMLIKKMKDRYL